MIFPAIARNLGILSGRGEDFSPDESDTIRGIFAEKPDNLKKGIDLLRKLTPKASGTICPDTTIAELKHMVMESSDRYIGDSFGLSPEKVNRVRIALSG